MYNVIIINKELVTKEVNEMMRTEIDRNLKVSDKLAAMWNDLSEKARDVIATTDMWLIDDLFGNFDTPEDVNKFIEEEYTED